MKIAETFLFLKSELCLTVENSITNRNVSPFHIFIEEIYFLLLVFSFSSYNYFSLNKTYMV